MKGGIIQMEKTISQFTYLEPVHITITRGSRGGVGWEISVRGNDVDKILAQIKDIETKLIQFELETPNAIRRSPMRSWADDKRQGGETDND